MQNLGVSGLRKMKWNANIEGSDLARIEQEVDEVSMKRDEVIHVLKKQVVRFLLGLEMQV